MPDPTGFAASNTLWTTWGACRIHDLVKFASKRSETQAQADAYITARQAEHTATIAAFDAAAAEQIASASDEEKSTLQGQLDAEKATLLAAQAAEIETIQAQLAARITAMLPFLRVDVDPQITEQVDIAEAVGEAVDFVDVTIAEVDVEGEVLPYKVNVRCTPDVLFVTQNGDVAAADLADEALTRVHDDDTSSSYIVTAVTPIALNEPAPVFRVAGASGTVCVGVDSSVATFAQG